MATAKKSSTGGSGKGVAFAKRAKIDKAQKNMLIAVCVTSILLGVTIVGIIYLSKKISFNMMKISENGTVIEDFKAAQKELEKLSANVSALATNERLESVATVRSQTKCDPNKLKSMESEDGYSLNDIEIVRTCSALRVITDTLPSKLNQEAANSSLNWLIINDNKDHGLQGLANADTAMPPLTGENGEPISLLSFGESVSIKAKPKDVNKAITSIENSIRNFDISNVTISWPDYSRGKNDGEIEFGAMFTSYYSEKVSIMKKDKVICADEESKGCSKAKGNSI